MKGPVRSLFLIAAFTSTAGLAQTAASDCPMH
jgi:hypothetical protein